MLGFHFDFFIWGAVIGSTPKAKVLVQTS